MARQFHWHEIRRRRKARAGKNSFPPTPSLFARPSVQFGARLPAEASAQARSAPSVPFKKGSDFVKQTHQIGLRNFLCGETRVRSPRRMARLARNWAVKSNGGGGFFLKWERHFSFWGSVLQVFGQCGGASMRTRFWILSARRRGLGRNPRGLFFLIFDSF